MLSWIKKLSIWNYNKPYFRQLNNYYKINSNKKCPICKNKLKDLILSSNRNVSCYYHYHIFWKENNYYYGVVEHLYYNDFRLFKQILYYYDGINKNQLSVFFNIGYFSSGEDIYETFLDDFNDKSYNFHNLDQLKNKIKTIMAFQ